MSKSHRKGPPPPPAPPAASSPPAELFAEDRRAPVPPTLEELIRGEPDPTRRLLRASLEVMELVAGNVRGGRSNAQEIVEMLEATAGVVRAYLHPETPPA